MKKILKVTHIKAPIKVEYPANSCADGKPSLLKRGLDYLIEKTSKDKPQK